MAAPITIPLSLSSYSARSRMLNGQQHINVFPELDQGGDGKSQYAFHGTPGRKLFCNTGLSAEVRGIFSNSAGVVCAVVGKSVYRISSGGVATQATGSLGSSYGQVSFADNGNNVVVVDGTSSGYIIDGAVTTVTAISDTDFVGGDRIAYLDGFLINNDPGTQRFQYSSLLGTDYDGLDFASAEGSPDKIVSLIVDHRELWLFGDQSTEVWCNSGDTDNPFSRLQGAFLEAGCIAKHSPVQFDNTVVWLGGDKRGSGIVWRANGYTPMRISTHAMETAMRGYSRIDDAIGFCYQLEGHTFYQLTFPTADRSWIYDAATNAWQEIAWHDSNGQQGRVRDNCYCFAFGKHLVGDYENGKIYELDLNTYTDNGDAIHRVFYFSHIHASKNGIRHDVFELDMEVGVGLDGTVQGTDPQVMLSWSDDGGMTWSNEVWRSIGAIGNYQTRVRWDNLGDSRDRVYRIHITDPVKLVILAAYLTATPLRF